MEDPCEWMAKMPQPPEPPPARIVCDACGELQDGKHTSWICRFLNWVGKICENNAKSVK